MCANPIVRDIKGDNDDDDNIKRCKYIAYEHHSINQNVNSGDEDNNSEDNNNFNHVLCRSLSVEELAMEEYHYGRSTRQNNEINNNN